MPFLADQLGNGFLQQFGVAGDESKKRMVGAPVVPVPLIATEGKTDWKHLKAALAKLKASGMFDNLEVKLWEYGDDQPMGSGEALSYCMKLARVPQLRPIIWAFDRDEPAIVRQVCGHDGKPKSWGNKVFSFAIPVPDHRSDSPDICLEFYYKDGEASTAQIPTLGGCFSATSSVAKLADTKPTSP